MIKQSLLNFWVKIYNSYLCITALIQIIYKMSKFYDQLCQTFIRPSRQLYNAYDLGHPITQKSKRTDFHVMNNRQHRIMCSYYMNTLNSLSPCIVYLHSLNGSRLESLSFIDQVMGKGFHFCAFDFSGTGLSQGKYVSLGFFQKFDISAVLEYVSEKFNITKFSLWGRSMGAAAAIKFMSMIGSSGLNKSIKSKYEIESIILDSPFHSLSELTVQIAKQKIKIPQIFIKAILIMIQSSIQSKAGFKLSQMELLEDVKTIKCPVLLLTSREDKLVHSSHSQKIYDTITHKDRQIMFIRGEHNQNRQTDTIEYILEFVKNCLNKKKSKINSKQNIHKSSKLFYNYKSPTNLAVSSAVGTKSYTKLENNSDFVRYETCGDEDIFTQKESERQLYRQLERYKQREKVQYNSIQENNLERNSEKQHFSQSIDNIKNNIFKKSLNLCSAKIDKEKYRDKYKQKNSQMKTQSKDLTTQIKHIVFRPLNQQRQKKVILTDNKAKTDVKNEIIFQYQSEKKVPNQNFHKISLQINRSPTKDPPRLHFQNKPLKDSFSTPISKQSTKNHNEADTSKSFSRQNLPLSEKAEAKTVERKKLQFEIIPEQHEKTQSPNIQVNHFNIINQKLKRKKKKESADSEYMRVPEPKDNRTVSVSIERKSQIPVKSPPEFIKSKLFHEHQQIRYKNV